jgi:hypothetical protein
MGAIGFANAAVSYQLSVRAFGSGMGGTSLVAVGIGESGLFRGVVLLTAVADPSVTVAPVSQDLRESRFNIRDVLGKDDIVYDEVPVFPYYHNGNVPPVKRGRFLVSEPQIHAIRAIVLWFDPIDAKSAGVRFLVPT